MRIQELTNKRQIAAIGSFLATVADASINLSTQTGANLLALAGRGIPPDHELSDGGVRINRMLRHADEIFSPDPPPMRLSVSVENGVLVIRRIRAADPAKVAEAVEGKRVRRVYTRGVHSGRKCYTPDFGGVS